MRLTPLLVDRLSSTSKMLVYTLSFLVQKTESYGSSFRRLVRPCRCSGSSRTRFGSKKGKKIERARHRRGKNKKEIGGQGDGQAAEGKAPSMLSPCLQVSRKRQKQSSIAASGDRDKGLIATVTQSLYQAILNSLIGGVRISLES